MMDIDTSMEWAELLKALAHPTRLQIVAELLKGTKCVSDIPPSANLASRGESPKLLDLFLRLRR